MSNGTPDISVIIVSWNVRDLLERCLLSIAAQKGVVFEVFVVDNASSDSSAAMVREKFPQVSLIVNDTNRGFAAANNQAYHRARGRHVLLLNPDTELKDGVLENTARFLNEHPKVGVMGCRTENPDGSLQASVNRFPTLGSQILVMLKLHVLAPWIPAIREYNWDGFDYSKESEVDQVRGAFFAVRKQCMEEMGGLDEAFFVWFEEVDFCKRVIERGWKVVYTPQFSIIHHGGESFGQLRSTRQQKIFNTSLLTYFKKHHPGLPYYLIAAFSIPSMMLAWIEQQIRRWSFIEKRLKYR